MVVADEKVRKAVQRAVEDAGGQTQFAKKSGLGNGMIYVKFYVTSLNFTLKVRVVPTSMVPTNPTSNR